MQRIKKNDTVIVLTGKDKGKKGSVIDILSKKGKVKVRGIAVITKHVKAKRQGESSAIRREESFIDLSNVMFVDVKTGKPCRIGVLTSDNGKRERMSVVSKEAV